MRETFFIPTYFQQLIRAMLLIKLLLLASCQEFTQDSFIGVIQDEDTAEGGASDGGSNAPSDDDDDGLSNEVEVVFEIETRVADTDFDGFDDGLEFVGLDGDPLDGGRSPTPLNRSRILQSSDAVRSDPDRDLDGLGDSFERENGLDETNPDTDGDGYQDGIELVANSDPFVSTDRPSREAPPAFDGVTRTGTPPRDSDGDGLSDTIEGLNGTRTNNRDSDGDGFSDGLELLMGSDGTDFLSIPNFSVPIPPDSSS